MGQAGTAREEGVSAAPLKTQLGGGSGEVDKAVPLPRH